MTTVAAEAVRPGGASVWLALAKPRLNALAVATVGIGYYLGAREFDLAVLLCVVAGSGLVAGGGAAFNQVAEIFALLAARFLNNRTNARARTLFLGSLIVLPVIWTALVAGHAAL